jgi:hypothetical protein
MFIAAPLLSIFSADPLNKLKIACSNIRSLRGHAEIYPIMRNSQLTREPFLELNAAKCAKKVDYLTGANCHVCTSPGVGLGFLNIFSLEFLQYILSKLDLRTLTDFRCVNQLALHFVASIHAHDTLCGILKIETSRWITCETVYSHG